MEIVYGLLLSGLMHFSESTLATSLNSESSSSCRSLSDTYTIRLSIDTSVFAKPISRRQGAAEGASQKLTNKVDVTLLIPASRLLPV